MAAILAAVYFGYPAIRTALTTASTDDAYVNSHVTFVAPRINETVVEVRVDNNDFVKKGELILVLDKAVWTLRVEQDEAALELARKTHEQQLAMARATAAAAKSNRYKLAAAISDVKNQVATLRGAVATLNERQAEEKLAKLEADRYRRLAEKNSVPQEQADVRVTQFEQSRASVREALEKIHSIRAALELPEEPPPGKPLEDVSPNLDQRHSSVLSALGALALNLAELGVALPSETETPDELIARIRQTAPNGDIDKLIEQTVNDAPGVATARVQILQAEKNLALSRLQLSYCEIYADIDGFISNRNVNPGDRVAQNQRLMAIRSSEEVWVDANFKETQLEPIVIGQPVDIYVDAYPGKVFKGRVQGFSPGTGSSLALLPAQNATGNFVKIVQRLPVRIDLLDGNPPETPLFVGLSVIPYIKIRERPEGPNAGQRLRGLIPAEPKHAPQAASTHPSS
jgi:membrane fusion protein (multidrug efflux system)